LDEAHFGQSSLTDAPDICRMSAVQMARLTREGKLSARETLEAHLAHIVTLVADEARHAGVPGG
jgi:hypothetical protein